MINYGFAITIVAINLSQQLKLCLIEYFDSNLNRLVHLNEHILRESKRYCCY